MSPEFLESSSTYSPEKRIESNKYMDVERGDTDISLFSNTPTTQQTQKKQFDPVTFVSTMLSSGFTPSRQQIMRASSASTLPRESSEFWFSILLIKLIHQEKLDRARGK
jgi:hypothetical protein